LRYLRYPFKRKVIVGGIAVLVAGVFAATAAAAGNPHLESATAGMAGPTVTSPGTIAWKADLTVPFQVAGLGNNPGITVSLSADSAVSIINTHAGSLTVNQTGGNGSSITLMNDVINGPVALSQNAIGASASFTSDRNGTAFGTVSIPTEIDLTAITSACIHASWTHISLTVGTTTVSLPNVSQTYDPTGTACPT
jgi:hypothetical protein